MSTRISGCCAILPLFLTGVLAAQQAAHHHPAARPPERVPLYDDLGRHTYAVTTDSSEAKRYFDQGLRLHWAFNHVEAARSFREAERLDPSCAMCAWGVAYASGPNINAPMEPAAADTALAAIRRATAAAGRASPQERALIDALSVRYHPTAPRARLDSAYAVRMSEAAERFPDDLEIRTIHADALMNLSPWNYWTDDGAPRPDTPRILASLEAVLSRNPDHPGACHLYIHTIEAHEPRLGLPCAERLAGLMPGAGHIVHMPGHIYIRVGRYRDAVDANRHAVHADQTYLEGPAAKRSAYGSSYYPHNHHFLAFAAAMMGAGELAIEHALAAARAVDPAVAREIPWIEAITPIGYWTLVTFGRWERILRLPLPAADLRFTTGMAYYARGTAFAAKRRWAEARAALDTVNAIATTHPEGDNRTALHIAAHALAGEITLRHGEADEAVEYFRAAAALEDGMAYTEPPTWYYPVRHSLGAALLDAGRPHEAERVYREDLERFPENGWSLFGLWQSLKAQGLVVQARDVKTRFAAAWADADVTLRASRF